ncbi:protein obstructor-E-like [Pollicipes pollicipes]|uniref:protein obstructor-E-like n=1 Tax=Pollicipes pollicipes TaxID=41117 RepID=UPI001884C3AE|nr:protein obstructor-E-like [Pollicipes pollicipes]
MRSLAAALALLALVHHGACQGRSENPCKRRGGTSAHEQYCDKFYECVGNDEVLVRDCPNGLVYAGRQAQVDVCGYEHEYPCDVAQLRNAPIPTEHCDWLYGIFGHETSCTRYWTCWNGTSVEQFCIGGLLYNEKTHACDWPEFVADCQKHPLCAEDANGNVPLGKSCERYWSCQGGYPRLMRCPATLVFDKISRRCVHPPTDDCDIPPTEAPEPADEQRPQQGGQQRQQFVSGNRGRRPVGQPRPDPAPQQLDVEEDIEYIYEDEEPFEPGFSSAPAQDPAPPSRIGSRQPPARASFRRPSGAGGGGRPPLRGPAIPAGATLVN